MNISEILGNISGLVFLIAGILYVKDVYKGSVSLNVATFFVWTVLSISKVTSLVVERIWYVVPFIVVTTVINITTLLLPIKTKKFYFRTPDKLALLAAALGLITWYVAKDAAWNIYVLSFVNLAVFIPLIIKSFKRPDLETVLPWRINLAASLLLVLAIPSFELVQWIVPAQQFICSLLLNIGLSRVSNKWRSHDV